MKILGIETSCDETSASVVENGQLLLSNVVASSMDLHAVYGGVVPEIAARSHIEHMMPVVEKALSEAFYPENRNLELGTRSNINSQLLITNSELDPWDQIDAIAVTQGPGLGGSLLAGVLTARTLAIAKKKPLYAVNHVSAHPFATFLTLQGPSLQEYVLPPQAPEFPMLALIVSGGHSQIVLFQSPLVYELLGQTRDDAIGEAFDKVAKILGLPYPGGPSVGKMAEKGDPFKYQLPKAKLDKPYEFSFSGLKTAVLRLAQAEIGEDYGFPSVQLSERLSEAQKADISASFQRIAVETVVEKTLLAYHEHSPASVVVAGGVAANPELRRQLAEALPIMPIYTDMKLCTDNGAMIATLAYHMAKGGVDPADPYTLDIKPNFPM